MLLSNSIKAVQSSKECTYKFFYAFPLRTVNLTMIETSCGGALALTFHVMSHHLPSLLGGSQLCKQVSDLRHFLF